MNDEFDTVSFLQRNGRTLVSALGEVALQSPIRTRQLSRNKRSIVISLQAGEQEIVVKFFDNRHPEAEQSIHREIAVLKKLKASRLVPKLLASSLDGRFFAMDHIHGSAIVDDIDAGNIAEIATDLGRWFADFSNQIPQKRLSTNWFDYLNDYRIALTTEERSRYREFLSGLPIECHAISKNDAYLGNFIRAMDGRLVGIDFDSAVFKPLGWDILITARVLARRFPDRIEEVARALVKGWGGGTDTIPEEEFVQLIMCFALCTAFKELAGNAKLECPH